MKFKQHLINQLQQGQIVLDYVNSKLENKLEVLKAILKLAFPLDNTSYDLIGRRNYYRPNLSCNSLWTHFDKLECNKTYVLLDNFIDNTEEDSFILPEKWCIKRDKDNYKVINEYFNKISNNDYYNTDYFVNNTGTFLISKNIQEGFKEITFDQFKKYILKENNTTVNTTNRFPYKLNIENAKRILAIACTSWQSKLANLWAKDLLLNNYVIISEDFYKEMRKSCTEAQHNLLNEIFGTDVVDNSVDVSNIKIEENDFIDVRTSGEYKGIAFYLDKYNTNWEIKEDSNGTLCLIPTKK